MYILGNRFTCEQSGTVSDHLPRKGYVAPCHLFKKKSSKDFFFAALILISTKNPNIYACKNV